MIQIDKIEEGVAAIDIGSQSYFVAVANQPVRQFGTFTGEIRQVAEYLRGQGVQRVAMEATGVYWIPLHDYLDSNSFEVTVFNGAGARNMPGRKTDVADCRAPFRAGHAMLHSHGLLHSCFIPPAEIRELRTYYRIREGHLESSTRCIHQMQKYLDLMNVRLHNVISQIHGVSGLRVIEAILAGERDAVRLAGLCDAQILKRKRPEVLASLEGTWDEHHLFGLRQALEGYRFFQAQMVACDREIERLLEELNQGKPPAPQTEGKKGTSKGTSKGRHNAPQIADLHGKLVTLCNGCDATVLPGISPTNLLKLVGEVGTDLSAWPTEKHFTAWLGLAPTRHESGKRRKRVKRRKTAAGQIFKEAVMGVASSKDQALGAFYRRIKGKKGPAVANTATARKIAELFYRAMTQGLEYVEEGVHRYDQRYREQSIRRVQKMAQQLGLTVVESTLEPAICAQVH
jgi:transposase